MEKFLVEPEFIWKGLDNYRKIFTTFNDEEFKDLKKDIENLFIKNRESFCKLFNEKIGDINKEYDKLGLPLTKNGKEFKYAEDVHPRYIKFVIDKLKNDFDELNSHTGYFRALGWEIRVNPENGDFYANNQIFNVSFEAVLYPVKLNKNTGKYERYKFEELETA